ncbi:MAG: hypothetical protein ACI9WT_001356, partial [Flavobacterium sp.]
PFLNLIFLIQSNLLGNITKKQFTPSYFYKCQKRKKKKIINHF